jgi:RNA polymerase sigma factor for flagellar operon FliA
VSTDAAIPHFRLVQAIATVVARKAGSGIERDDLVSVGTLAVLESLARFDASRGVPLAAFVRARIRGSMIDHLRQHGSLHRTRGGREWRWHQLDIDDDACHPTAGSTALDDITRGELGVMVEDCVASLPEDERAIVEHHDLGERPLNVVARELGLSPDRASKIRRRALCRMRRELRGPYVSKRGHNQ